jgi:hypothetical protein
MGNNRNTAYTCQMIASHPFSNKMCKLLTASKIEMHDMHHVIIPCNTNVRHFTHYQTLIKTKIHVPNPPIHPQIVMPLEVVDKSHICVSCSLCNEADIIFNWTMIVSIHATSWPFHYNTIISPSNLSQVLNIFSRRFCFHYIANVKLNAWIFLKLGANSTKMTASQ